MADRALRRRLRDEQRSITYREAVRLGLRRPWTERQVAMAKAALKGALNDSTIRDALLAMGPQGGIWRQRLYDRKHARRHDFSWIRRCQERLRAWAERVLRETAELNGEGA